MVSKLIHLPKITDPRGNLTFLEGENRLFKMNKQINNLIKKITFAFNKINWEIVSKKINLKN